jgi:cobalt-zinc-cadmium efflux system outer membrane protein
MRTSRALLVGLALALSGCFSSSLSRDLVRVRELSHLPAADVTGPVPAGVPSDVRALLSGPIDADAAARAALLGNRELRATLRELGVERGLLMQAGLLPNPTFEVEIAPERNSDVELRVELDVTAALLAPLRASAAEADLEAARLRAAGAVVQAGFEARSAFYAYLAADERAKVLQRWLETFAAGRDAGAALLEAGNVPELRAAAEDAAYQDARLAVAAAELDRVRARERLQRLFGVDGEALSWTAKAPLAAAPAGPPSFEGLEAAALGASLDLRALRSSMLGHARRADLARAEKLVPDAAVDVHVLAGGDPLVGQAVQVGGGVSFTLPLLDQGQGTARAHEARLDAAGERYRGVAVSIRSAARTLRAELESAHARARHVDETLLPARRRVTRETLLQVNAMQLGVFELLAARRAELHGELARVEARRAYHTASAALEALRAGKAVELAASSSAPPSPATSIPAGGH